MKKGALFFLLATSASSSLLQLTVQKGFQAGGACENTDDLGIFKTHASDFHSILEKCAQSTLGNAGKTASCLAAGTGLSNGCSQCFGVDAHCVAVNCLSKCISDPSSAACLQCQVDQCQPALVTCTGVPASDLPKAEGPSLLVFQSPLDGACNNTDDLGVFKAHASDFHADLQKCATQTLGNADKTAQCLSSATGLSSGCAECFGQDAHCCAVNCIKQCLTAPTSPACLQCQVDNCQPALLTCAGVPASVIPK
mmetsp:Transcript_39477/g.77656  ORF Transcript_39477/g.77656 Transcript_39477/m.77656 type:complete len:253 (+) Transcript_39477:54-812(+)